MWVHVFFLTWCNGGMGTTGWYRVRHRPMRIVSWRKLENKERRFRKLRPTPDSHILFTMFQIFWLHPPLNCFCHHCRLHNNVGVVRWASYLAQWVIDHTSLQSCVSSSHSCDFFKTSWKNCVTSFRAYGFEGSNDPGCNSFSLQAVGRVVFLVTIFFYRRNSLLL